MQNKKVPESWKQKTKDAQEISSTAPKIKSMSYIQNTLNKNEEILHRSHISLFKYFFQLVFIVFASFIQIINLISLIFGNAVAPFLPLIIILPLTAWVYLGYKSSEFAVTNKKILVKHGLIARETFEYPLNKIDSIQVQQSVLGRLLNYGDLIISGAGNATPRIRFIKRPLDMRTTISEELDKRDK